MKKSIFFLFVLTLSATLIASDGEQSDTKKTHLRLRDHRHRAALFTTFHELQQTDKNRFATKLQMTGFYNSTLKQRQLGEVFGTNYKNKITVDSPLQVALGRADVNNNFLLHYASAPENNTLQGTISFDPRRIAYGTHIEAYIGLDPILEGLYFKENYVLATVKQDLNVRVSNAVTGATASESHKLLDLLSGKSVVRRLGVNGSEQEPLNYAKLGGSQSRTGLSNIETILGWRSTNKNDYYFGVQAVLQSPSGDRPTGEYLFEPTLGNNHWGIGAGLETGANLWEDDTSTVRLMSEVQYRYHLKGKEKRTLGIKNTALSHYYLLGEKGKYSLTPAANIFTKEVYVHPKSEVDWFVALNYNLNGFVFDIAYNFFWLEKEKIKLKKSDWEENRYGIAKFDWQTCSSSFALSDAQSGPINYDNIDTSVAQNKALLSHSVVCSLGYKIDYWKHPIIVAIGGEYEVGEGRSSADSYSLWIKGELAF